MSALDSVIILCQFQNLHQIPKKLLCVIGSQCKNNALQLCDTMASIENAKTSHKFFSLIFVSTLSPLIFQAVSLMSVDLVRQQPKWKQAMSEMRQMMASLAQEGFQAANMRPWKLHCDSSAIQISRASISAWTR